MGAASQACPTTGKNWGPRSLCLCKGTDCKWHCPFEGSSVISQRAWGGCGGFKILCGPQGTDCPTVLTEWTTQSSAQYPADGNKATYAYEICCPLAARDCCLVCSSAPWMDLYTRW